MTLLSVSQDTLTQIQSSPIQLVINNNDTCGIVPITRLRIANVKILKGEACYLENIELRKVTDEQKNQIANFEKINVLNDKVNKEKDIQIESYEKSLVTKDQQISMKDDEKKSLKKQNTKLTIGVIAEGVIILIFTGVALFGGG